MTWVLDNSESTSGARLVLLVLAEHAHDDGSESYPSVETIMRRTRMSRRGVQEALRRLESDAHIAQDGVSRKGTVVYRVVMGAQNPRGRGLQREGGAADAPEPSIGTRPNKKENAHASKREELNGKAPDGFPVELRRHANEVYVILKRVAEVHGAQRVWPRAVGLAIMAHPRHPLVATAHELEGWAVDPPRPVRDVVKTYRTFLSRARELEGVERLAEDGTPAAPGPRGVVNGSRPADARRAGKEWATRRNMALMRGMSEPEAQAFASSSEPIAALHAVPSAG